MLETADRTGRVIVYYDGDCPFCSHYVRYQRLSRSAGPPTLVDVRKAPEARASLEAEGFDLDKGMVADISGVRYGGADAMNALALLTTPSGVLNRVTSALFASRTVSRLAYPLLRAGRNATLTLLGREPIRSDDKGWFALFQIFSMVFGLFAVLHFFVYAFKYTNFDVYPSTWAILASGLALLFWPGSKRAFILLIAAMAVDAWLHAPIFSNHTMLKNFVLLAFLGSAAWHVWKGSSWTDFFRDAVPVGRVLLLVMYFYGVFHKINEGFLDPSVSCAVELWRVMPWPIHLFDNSAIHYLTIYGTFVVETVIAIMLLVPRTRHFGIIAGVGFHGFLALSGFAMYPAFTTLAIALHTLFLSPDRAQRIVEGRNFNGLTRQLRGLKGIALLLTCMLLIASFAIARDYAMVGVTWSVLAALVVGVILFPGKPALAGTTGQAGDAGRLLWSRLIGLNLIGALFFFNGATPYMGLKTAQSMNMFANLRVEGGVNNHLVMRWMPAPFGYLDDVVEIREASGDAVLERAASSGGSLVYYHLLDRLDRSPGATVTFERHGALHSGQTAATLSGDIATTLHPAWFRKWFHFGQVPAGSRPRC